MTEPLLQERFESGKNNIPDVVADFFKRRDYGRSACWPFLAERYLRGEAGIELEYRIRAGLPEIKAGEYRVIFKRAKDQAEISKHVVSPHIPDADAGIGGDGASGQRVPVFAYVRQHVKEPKGVALLATRSVVRLEKFDLSLRGGSDLLHPPLTFADGAPFLLGHGVLSPRLENGEVCPIRMLDGAGVPLSKGGNKVVEGVSEVVDAIPDQGHQAKDGQWLSDLNSNQPLAGLYIAISDVDVGLAIRVGFGGFFESLKIGVCLLKGR
jgi:hypothetical protein